VQRTPAEQKKLDPTGILAGNGLSDLLYVATHPNVTVFDTDKVPTLAQNMKNAIASTVCQNRTGESSIGGFKQQGHLNSSASSKSGHYVAVKAMRSQGATGSAPTADELVAFTGLLGEYRYK
jgi:hypothetical protein